MNKWRLRYAGLWIRRAESLRDQAADVGVEAGRCSDCGNYDEAVRLFSVAKRLRVKSTNAVTRANRVLDKVESKLYT